ncbi:hypothetical protein, partial [Actinomadura luteofluorescens]
CPTPNTFSIDQRSATACPPLSRTTPFGRPVVPPDGLAEGAFEPCAAAAGRVDVQMQVDGTGPLSAHETGS